MDELIKEYPNALRSKESLMAVDTLPMLFELDKLPIVFAGTGAGAKADDNTLAINIDEELKEGWPDLYKEIMNVVAECDFVINKYIYETDSVVDNLLSHSEIIDVELIKYNQNEGLYAYHIDNNKPEVANRIMTTILYLNTVEKGGETHFKFTNKTVKPEKGKLVCFPTGWPYVHAAHPPISSSKYVLVMWREMVE